MNVEFVLLVGVLFLWGAYNAWRYSTDVGVPRLSWALAIAWTIAWGWAALTQSTPLTVDKVRDYKVEYIAKPDGAVVAVIKVGDETVNLNRTLGASVPDNVKVRRIDYVDTVLGLKLNRPPRYELIP